jgi:hypothetical protein
MNITVHAEGCAQLGADAVDRALGEGEPRRNLFDGQAARNQIKDFEIGWVELVNGVRRTIREHEA